MITSWNSTITGSNPVLTTKNKIMIYDKIKSLIGKQVTAIGSCGMAKNNSVEGLLSLDKND